MKTLQLFPVLLLLFFSARTLEADSLYLKNGGVIEGIIEKEDENKVEIGMGFGSAIFNKRQLRNIERSTSEENDKTVKKWEIKRKELTAKTKEFEEARQKRSGGAYEYWMEEAGQKKLKEEGPAEHIRVARDERTKNIVVETLLNGKIKANLVLDTGASLVVLSRSIGEELGLDMTDTKKDIMELMLADGRRSAGKAVILDSVRIQDVEVNKVMAAVMLEEAPKDPSLRDGLLGMSFLNRFNLKIDLKSMKVTLEKINTET